MMIVMKYKRKKDLEEMFVYAQKDLFLMKPIKSDVGPVETFHKTTIVEVLSHISNLEALNS